MATVSEMLSTGWKNYVDNTDAQLKIVDCFLVYFAIVAKLQIIYGFIVGSFPFNALLAGFFSALGMFVLTVCLRIQINPSNRDALSNNGRNKPISREKAFADYVLCNIVLHLVVINFIG